MRRIFAVFLFSILIFWQSFFTFFTNDDFYFLNISQNSNFKEVVGYFNIFTQNPDGFGAYRPLSTQLYYIIHNQYVMHVIATLVFGLILLLIFKLSVLLFKNEKSAIIAAFLYAVSATHFAHFYYLSTFQELLMTCFVLLSILSFINKKYLITNICFVLGLMSKENAVTMPFLLFITVWYLGIKVEYKRYFWMLIILVIYLYSHFYLYGTATGDSYIWNFTISKALNTIFWYGVWSLSLPETMVDFVGPGFKVNPNLFKYWGNIVIPIISLVVLEISILIHLLFKNINTKDAKRSIIFGVLWFLISLLPVLFLPEHKFSFYLTLPLVGVVYIISFLIFLRPVKKFYLATFLGFWTIAAILTISHSVKTSWITQGAKISEQVYFYFLQNPYSSTVNFVDTEKDESLPWSPTMVLKNALSDKNFFYVYFPNLADKIEYNGKSYNQIESRQFLGY